MVAVEVANGNRISELEKLIADLQTRLELYEAKQGYMTADQMIERANAWIVRNPKAWAFIKDQARMCVSRKGRFSVKRAIENLRDSSLVTMGDDDWKISNSYSAVFVRLLIREIPELAKYTKLNASKVDRLMPDVMETYKAAHV